MIKTSLANWIRAILALWAITLALGVNPQNPLCLAGLAALYALFSYRKRVADHRALAPPVRITGVLYALLTVAATHGEFTATYTLGAFRLGLTVIALAGLLLFWDAFLPLATERVLLICDTPGLRGGSVSRPVRLLLTFPTFTCLLGWLPAFLYEYPGIFSPDGIVQIGQLAGIEPLSNHHPMIHTWTIGFFMKIGSLFTADPTHQAAFYIAAQMIFLAFCCGQVVRHLARKRLVIPAAVTALLFAFLPYNGIFAVYCLKDIPFTGITLLFTLTIADLTADKARTSALVRFGIIGFLFCTFRSNGYFAFFLIAALLLLLLKKRPVRVKLLTACMLVILTATLYRSVFLPALGISGGDLAEKLHIPLQQISRVLVMDRTLSPTDRALIEAAVDTTYIKELYVPDYADNVKELLRAGHPEVISENKGTYLLLWLRIGLHHPGDYLEALIDHTRGIWYPVGAPEVAMIDGVYPNELGIESRPIIGGPVIVKCKELLLKSGPLLPVLTFLWSMGFFFWALLYLTALTLVTQTADPHRAPVAVLFPSYALYATLMLAIPLSDFRYVYPMVLSLPIWLTAPLQSPQETTDNPQTPAAQDVPL
ncbi:MAG: DUF6020 family protein [Lachnospiraceae bacterium]|nr:DUF6020 family protein [Lachnospiraceae bacterium]